MSVQKHIGFNDLIWFSPIGSRVLGDVLGAVKSFNSNNGASLCLGRTVASTKETSTATTLSFPLTERARSVQAKCNG